MASNLEIGKIGEQIASSFLQSKGITIVEYNFRTKFGEIDIVGKKDNKTIFVEVKTRIGEAKGKPYEAVNARKISHLKMASTLYVLKNKLKNTKLSLQVVSIVLRSDLKIQKILYFDNLL